jgi:hypothetical protein
MNWSDRIMVVRSHELSEVPSNAQFLCVSKREEWGVTYREPLHGNGYDQKEQVKLEKVYYHFLLPDAEVKK